jgi:hypothetical protein
MALARLAWPGGAVAVMPVATYRDASGTTPHRATRPRRDAAPHDASSRDALPDLAPLRL